MRGDEQGAQARASSLHWKVEPGSEERKRNTARRAATRPDGPAAIVVRGFFRSIVQECCDGVGSVVGTVSIARTWNVCAPPARPARSSGEEQVAKAAPSSEHSNVPGSFARKRKRALRLFVSAGGSYGVHCRLRKGTRSGTKPKACRAKVYPRFCDNDMRNQRVKAQERI